ncbi:hypothetical protein SeLEV6574_g07667 [Synchytrium endobioticum]|nr:hypothetical protein SeLEV6574_g07667 [Synchytrium endobioticum]
MADISTSISFPTVLTSISAVTTSILATVTSSVTPTAQPSPKIDNPVQEEISVAWSLLILISLLAASLMTSYYLQINRIRIIHESVVSIFLGIVVGLIIRFGSPAIQGIVAFDHRYFFNLLLPPIILHSGYDMKKKSFFRYIGSIMTFALLGTFISTLIIGVLVYILVLTGMHRLKMSMMDCLVFGAILSSTDPVAVLSLFHQMKVDPKLYAIIFGESILNDSVAIVLFSTLGQFNGKDLSIGNVALGIVSFFGVFVGSILCGVIVSLVIALLLKYSQLHQFPSLESCLVVILAYSSYLLSNGLQLSGIVSLLFCGIILKHYAYDNMSRRSRRTTKYMFRVLSQLSENFVFIYLGVTLYTNRDELYLPGLIIFALAFIVLARYASVIPLARLINMLNRKLYPNKPDLIPRNHQLMLWWAGLRGAIAFALSFDVSGPAAQAIRTTTLVVCVISVIVLGGTTPRVIKELGIKTGVERKRRTSPNLSNNDSTAQMDGDVDDFDDDDTDSSDGELLPDWADSGVYSTRHHYASPVEYVDLNSHTFSDSVLPNGTSLNESAGESTNEWNDGTRTANIVSGNQTSSPSRLSFSSSINGMRDSISALLGQAARIREEDIQHWFISFDNQYLKPVFTRQKWTLDQTHPGSSQNGHVSSPSDHRGRQEVRPPRFPSIHRIGSNHSGRSCISNGGPYSKLADSDTALGAGSASPTGSRHSDVGKKSNTSSTVLSPLSRTSSLPGTPLRQSHTNANDDVPPFTLNDDGGGDKLEDMAAFFSAHDKAAANGTSGNGSIGTVPLVGFSNMTGSTSSAIIDAFENDEVSLGLSSSPSSLEQRR